MKKFAKRSLIIFLTLIIVVSFSACKKKVDTSAIQICIIDKGYGTTFLDSLVEEFNKKSDKKAQVVKRISDASFTATSLLSGSKANDIDLYFAIETSGGLQLIYKGQNKGFDNVLEDLSSLYNESIDGYGDSKPLSQVIDPYFYDAITYCDSNSPYNGKQFSVPWATAIEGLLYNTALFDKYNLSVPRTTNELFELLETIKNLKAKTADGKDIYGYTFSGKVCYGLNLTNVWWAQYEGLDAFNYFLEGKDANGDLSNATIFKQYGRYSSYDIYSKIIARDGGYVYENDVTRTFTQSQQGFLAGQAFMMNTGDWLEREMENSTTAIKTISFMPIPVNSDVLDEDSAMPNHTIKTDGALRLVIDYLNGDSSALNKITAGDNGGVSGAQINAADIAYIAEAMKIYEVEGDGHVMLIPSYSNQIEGAKSFIKFVLSKSGQEIMLSKGSGNCCPLVYDLDSFNAYANLSQLQKSRKIIRSEANFIGRKYNSPITFNGGLSIVNKVNSNFCDAAFGVEKQSPSYMTAEQFWLGEYDYVNSMWETILSNAGIK